MPHEDEDPVEFEYDSSVNISFRGREESETTWGEWRKLTTDQKWDRENEFIRNVLGVDVTAIP
jgi:hypothetical protein